MHQARLIMADKVTSRRIRWLLRLDEAALCWVRSLEVPCVTAFMRCLTRLGDVGTWVMLGLLLFACGGQATIYACLLTTGAILATAISQVLKRLCRRTRPSLGLRGFVALAENPDTFSFPSGHTTVAVAVAIALAGQGTALGALMASVAAGVGISRVYLGAHYPLDVAAGVVLGSAAGVGARLIML